MKTMQKSEFKLLLFLLQDKDHANKTYRQIAAEAGMSLGSVQAKMEELSELGYLVKTAGRKVLRRRGLLTDRWAQGYAEGMKEKFFLQRFRFLAPEVRDHWADIRLGDDACWGGEPAAQLLDGYLRPQRWDIYVREKADSLIASGRMIPDPSGEIFVYKRFWAGNGIPLLVVYGDLLATGDDRCAEVAERLKDRI